MYIEGLIYHNVLGFIVDYVQYVCVQKQALPGNNTDIVFG